MSLSQDVRHALRQFRQNLGFTAAACLTLALGIGAVTSIFSVLYAVVLRPLPFPDPNRIVGVWTTRDGIDDVVIPRNFDAWRSEAKSFFKIAALDRQAFSLTAGSESIEVAGARVSADFFDVFGAAPELGRTFSIDEDRPGGPSLAVLSHRLWQQRFGADPGIVGRQIRLDRVGYTVIGVMPASFDLRPEGEQVWVGLALGGQEMSWAGGVLYVFGRVRPGVALGQAQQEMNLLSRSLERRYPDLNHGRGARVEPFAKSLVGDYGQRLLVLLGAALFVLLIACSNVANLLLGRGAARARELAIRSALGAGGARLFRQLLTESAVLALVGSGLGTALASGGIRVVRALSPASVPRIGEAALNAPALLFALALGLATTLLFGALPAWRTLRLEVQSGLKQGQWKQGHGKQGNWKLRSGYLAAEAGLALVLLAGAGLLIRSSIAAQRQSPGFSIENVLTAKTALPIAQYPDAAAVAGAYQRMLDRLSSTPGVLSASLSSKVPLAPGSMGLTLKPESVSSGSLRSDSSTDLRFIGSRYLATMGIPLRAGREFADSDRADSRQVMLVNQTLARRLWPGQDAVGQRIRVAELNPQNPVWEVVGVTGDVRENGLMQPAPAVVYLPFRQVATNPWQWTQQSVYLVAKTRVPPLSLAGPLLRAVKDVDAQLAVGDVQPMDQRFAASLSAARLYTLLLASLGLAGLLLTAVGIYAVVAYFVAQQRKEIALRVALGARPRTVLAFVMLQGMKPVAVGLLIGVWLAMASGQSLVNQLYAVSATDPVTLAVVAGLLALVAAAACLWPAVRIARADPILALHGD